MRSIWWPRFGTDGCLMEQTALCGFLASGRMSSNKGSIISSAKTLGRFEGRLSRFVCSKALLTMIWTTTGQRAFATIVFQFYSDKSAGGGFVLLTLQQALVKCDNILVLIV